MVALQIGIGWNPQNTVPCADSGMKMPHDLPSCRWFCCAQGLEVEVWEHSSRLQTRIEHKYHTSINLSSWNSEHWVIHWKVYMHLFFWGSSKGSERVGSVTSAAFYLAAWKVPFDQHLLFFCLFFFGGLPLGDWFLGVHCPIPLFGRGLTPGPCGIPPQVSAWEGTPLDPLLFSFLPPPLPSDTPGITSFLRHLPTNHCSGSASDEVDVDTIQIPNSVTNLLRGFRQVLLSPDLCPHLENESED